MTLSILNRSSIRWLMTALLLIGIALCLLVLRRTVDAGSIDLQFPPTSIVAITVLYAASIFLAALLWRDLLRVGGGIVDLPWRSVLLGFAALMIGKYLPGKVAGLFGRAVTLRGRATPAVAGALTLIEQAYVLAGWIAFAALMHTAVQPGAWWVPVAAAVICGGLFGPRLLCAVLRRLPARSGIVSDVSSILSLFTAKVGARLILLGAAASAAVAATAWFAPDLVGMELESAARLGLVAVYALSVVAGLLAFVSPGGIGVREAAFVLLAAPWLSSEHALAIAAVLRLINVVADLIVGSLGLALARSASPAALQRQ